MDYWPSIISEKKLLKLFLDFEMMESNQRIVNKLLSGQTFWIRAKV